VRHQERPVPPGSAAAVVAESQAGDTGTICARQRRVERTRFRRPTAPRGPRSLWHAAAARHGFRLASASTGAAICASGLSLTALQILSEGGTLTLNRVWELLQTEREPLPWIGDLGLLHVIEQMHKASEPVFIRIAATSGQRSSPQQLRITGVGRAILGGLRSAPPFFAARATGTHCNPRPDGRAEYTSSAVWQAGGGMKQSARSFSTIALAAIRSGLPRGNCGALASICLYCMRQGRP
jgi:hypothetical protein